MKCNRCEGSGFLNEDQITKSEIDSIYAAEDPTATMIEWIAVNSGHAAQVCDCCGDGENHYGVPGEHYSSQDPEGMGGVYDYNGGLAECS